MWKEVKNFQKASFLFLPPCVFGRFFVANGLGGGRGFGVGAEGRDSHHTVFRRSGRLRRKWNTSEPQAATAKEHRTKDDGREMMDEGGEILSRGVISC
jgi:hypothetical protein